METKKSIRKPYNNVAGYVASLKIRDGKYAVIYDNKNGKLGIDTEGKRWVTVSEPNGGMVTATNLKSARATMKQLVKDKGVFK